MRWLLGVLWSLVIGGGGALYWCYEYGSWRNAEGPDTLMAHDLVRFGERPTYLTISWLLLVLITLLVTAVLLDRKRSRNRRTT